MKPASERILTPSSSIGSEIRTFNIGSTVRGCSWRLCQRRSQLPQERLSRNCHRVPDGREGWRIASLDLRKLLNCQSEMGRHRCKVCPERCTLFAHELSAENLPIRGIREELHGQILATRIVGKPCRPRNSDRNRDDSDFLGRRGCWAEGCYFKPEEFDGGHASRSWISCLASSSIYACNH